MSERENPRGSVWDQFGLEGFTGKAQEAAERIHRQAIPITCDACGETGKVWHA